MLCIYCKARDRLLKNAEFANRTFPFSLKCALLRYGTGEKAVLDKSCYSVSSSDPFSASNVLRVEGRFPVLHKSIKCVLLGNLHVRPLLEVACGGRFPVLHKFVKCAILGNSHVRPLLEVCLPVCRQRHL